MTAPQIWTKGDGRANPADICRECGREADHAQWCEDYVPRPFVGAVDYHPARARNTDPQTSHDAAASVTGQTETQRHLLELLAAEPATDMDLMERWHPDWGPATPSGLRTRRSELTKAELVIDTGERRPSPSGRLCVVWGIS